MLQDMEALITVSMMTMISDGKGGLNMKKILYFIAALSLVSAVSCVKEEAPAPSTESMTVTLGFSDATKATLSDEWGITWSAGLTLKWDGGSHKLVDADIDKGANTVSFVAEGLEVGETITSENTPTYASYTQNAPGKTNWTKLFLKGVAAEAGKVTTMQIDGSILRFLPYANDEAAKAESVKSVTIEGLDKDYTVTLKDGFELSLAGITSKVESKSIFLPLASAEYNSFTVTVNMLSGAVYTFTSGDGKKLELNENEVVNMSLPLDASHKVAEYSVTFNTDGGSAVPAQNVTEGGTVTVPVGVTKDYAGSLAEGLYLGVQDPDNVSYTLEGWYTDAEKTQKYDFSTPVTAPLTLYAKWVSPKLIDIAYSVTDGVSDIFQKTYVYLNGLSHTEMTEYTMVIASDFTFKDEYYDGLNAKNVTLYVIGAATERTITTKREVVKVNKDHEGIVVFGKNITITASEQLTKAIIDINGNGKVTMKAGSKISGITTTAQCIVKMSSGGNTLTLEGGEIINNTINANNVAATIYMPWGGTLVMNAGSISNNVVTNTSDKVTVGGIYSPQNYSKITKNGGVISGNTAGISLTGGATASAQVVQQVLYKSTAYNTDLSESDNI